MPEQFQNNYSTQLNGSINSTDTTLTVDAVPSGMTGSFRIRIDSELILVGSVSGSTFINCVRGAEGTTAASHSDNAVVTHVLTKESLLNALGTGTSSYYLGKNAIGASWLTATQRRMYAKKIVINQECLLSSIGAYLQVTATNEAHDQSAFLFSDNGSGTAPDDLIAYSEVTSTVWDDSEPRWLDLAIGKWLTPGTYWIAFAPNKTSSAYMQIAYDTGGSDPYETPNFGTQSGDWAQWSSGNDSQSYSIRANIIVPGSGGINRDFSPNPTVDDDEFNTTDTSDPMIGWTTLGAPTAHNINSTKLGHYYVSRNSAGGNPSWSGIYKAIPSTPFTATAKLTASSGFANYASAGLFIGTSTPGAMEVMTFGYDGGIDRLGVFNYSSPTAYNSTVYASFAVGPVPLYQRIIVTTTTNVTWQYSHDGFLWKTLASSRNPGFTVGSIGLAQSGNSADGATAFDWVRFGTDVVQSESRIWQNMGTAGEYDPIQATFGTPTLSYEFDTPSLTGLTALGSPGIENANTTLKGHYYVTKAASSTPALTGRYISAPSAPFTAIAKLSDHNFYATSYFRVGGLFIGEASPGVIESAHVLHNGSWIYVVERYSNPTTYNSTPATGRSIGGAPNLPLYYGIKVNSSTDVDYYISMNGYIWFRVLAARNPSITIGSVGIIVDPENATIGTAAAYDYLRIWDSAKTFPYI